MKAYMSDSAMRESLDDRCWNPAIPQPEMVAFWEAKRILADVEPEGPGAFYSTLKTADLSNDVCNRTDLAEALENFVETLDKMGH